MLAETPSTDGWKTYEVTARVEVLKPSGVTHIWLPAALIRNTPYQKTLSNKFVADGGTANLTENQQDALGIVSATYPAGAKPVLTLTSVVSTKNYEVDLSKPSANHKASKAELAYLAAAQQVRADRRHRAGNRDQGNRRCDDGRRQGARALRVGRAEHVSAIPRCAAAAAATFASCWSRATWAASAPTSMRCM